MIHNRLAHRHAHSEGGQGGPRGFKKNVGAPRPPSGKKFIPLIKNDLKVFGEITFNLL